MTKKQIKARLEYLRGEIKAERISYGEIAELQSLAEHIEQDDVLLREWAGIPEFIDTPYGDFTEEQLKNRGSKIL